MNEPKHQLAILRKIIGITQKEMAALVGRSLATIQGIEYNEMPLSVGLANEIAVKTGVCIDWLLRPSDTAPYTDNRTAFTKNTYERTRSQDLDEYQIGDAWGASIGVLFILPRLLACVVAAHKKGEGRILEYRIRKFVEQSIEDFQVEPKLWIDWMEIINAPGNPSEDHETSMASRIAKVILDYQHKNKTIFGEKINKAQTMEPKKTTLPRRPRKQARGN